MATQTITIDDFNLKSTWSYQFNNGSGFYYGGTTPSTASKTITVNLSSIIAGSRVTSAKLAIRTTGSGTSSATCKNVKVNVTNDHIGSNAIDVTSWFSSLGTSASIKFSFQAFGTTSGSSSTGSASCGFRNMVITINYELPNSTGELDKTSVDAGDDITLTIAPVNAAYTHVVTWQLESSSTTKRIQSLAAGVVSDTWTVPSAAVSEITTGTSAQAKVYLQTYNDQTQVGQTKEYTFNITVPSSVVPTAGTLSATPVTVGLTTSYLQGYSKANLSLSDVAGVSGSTITSVVFSGWGSTANGTLSGTSYVAQTSTITTSGTITLTATVTDSRNRVCTKTLQITVIPYGNPAITSFTSKRCDSNGTLDDTGTYVRLVIDYNYASANGSNNPYTKSWYKISTQQDSAYQLSSDVNDPFITDTTDTQNGIVYVQAHKIVGGGLLSADNNYTIKISVLDELENAATAIASIPTASYVLHFRDGGKAIGIGMAALSTDNTVSVNSNWSVYIGGHNVGSELGSLTGQTFSDISGNLDLTSQVTGALPITNGGTGQTSSAGILSALGLSDAAHVTYSTQTNSEEVTSGHSALARQISISNGDIWEGIAVLGASADTDFRMFVDTDTDTSNYRSFMRYGGSSTRSGTNCVAFANASKKAIVKFTISRLANVLLFEGHCLRGDDNLMDFVVSKTVSSSDTDLWIKLMPTVAINANAGHAWKLRKLT